MTPIIIDTDMGVDDILAISLLLSNPNLTIKAISTVKGVADRSRGTNNLARILTYINREDIPIYQGNNYPQQRINFPVIDRQRANDLTLLKNLPIPKNPSNKISIKKLDKAFVSTKEFPTSLLCLGPLTNVARMIKIIPNFIDQIFIMGGAVFKPGNIPPDYASEYNISLDPVSAKVVFSSKIPLILIATDATSQASAKDRKFLNKVKSAKPQTPFGKIIKAIILNNKTDFLNFYDPLAAQILQNPSIITQTQGVNITVTDKGQTIGKISPESSLKLVTKIDKKLFYQSVLKSIS